MRMAAWPWFVRNILGDSHNVREHGCRDTDTCRGGVSRDALPKTGGIPARPAIIPSTFPILTVGR